MKSSMIGIAVLGVAAITSWLSGATLFGGGLQNAAAASASPSGGCEYEYLKCKFDTRQTDKQKCETAWSSCVAKKCVVKSSGSFKYCPVDLDCELSCTERASGKGGLSSCCFG